MTFAKQFIKINGLFKNSEKYVDVEKLKVLHSFNLYANGNYDNHDIKIQLKMAKRCNCEQDFDGSLTMAASLLTAMGVKMGTCGEFS